MKVWRNLISTFGGRRIFYLRASSFTRNGNQCLYADSLLLGKKLLETFFAAFHDL